MRRNGFLSVAIVVFFGVMSGSFKPACAGADDNKTPSITQKAKQYISDSEITLKVKTNLLQDKKTQHLDISVKTTEGSVLLTGVVKTTGQLNYVRQQVAKVPGVRTVRMQITVESDQKSSLKRQGKELTDYTSDTAITAKIKAKLLADSRLPACAITVETKEGVVKLTGVVDSQQQVKVAEEITWSVEAVKQVNNQLQIEK